ncbi:TPA: hypothetical protein DCL30_02855 [Candidatus Peribacteria bacterium]|nr:MAG: hypothetical protein A3J91_03230 [Candidatus Peribacteria bacterium RIFOXYC2_FULL_58_10]OGJ84670.1 MAG: hypothetical protein A2529_03885 [Candidatus Peribacteria bacterium RIFOXYD2_FULL_58_15]HAI98459.1 hypothetical protein [Candidatus Peribacteria bacterium]HAS34171.1 hypothetical protein [Candidatus Peribacteria bacterium]
MKTDAQRIARACIELSREIPEKDQPLLAEAALALLELKGLKSAIRIFPRLLKEASIALGGSEPVTVVFASKEHAEQSMHSLAAALKALPRSADIAAQHVEPSLIGGVRVEIGDERLEYTVRSLLLTAMQDLRNPSPQS